MHPFIGKLAHRADLVGVLHIGAENTDFFVADISQDLRPPPTHLRQDRASRIFC